MTTEQLPTRGVTITWVVSQPTFELGFSDGRAGRGFHPDFDQWDANLQWSYERGRQLAAVVPKTFALRVGGKANPKIRRWFKRGDVL